MKRFLVLVCLLLSVFALSAQQVRRVYITLDVSGSMNGAPYTLGNYTAQMIASLCDPEDEVYIIINGNTTLLSGSANPLNSIQRPIDRFSNGRWWESEFNDIVSFTKEYTASSKKQDWLFIIGDGEWFSDLDNEQRKGLEAKQEEFLSLLKGGSMHVCFMQTHNSESSESEFLRFIEPVGVVDIRKVGTNPRSIRSCCDYFARKILGFSEAPLKIEARGSNAVSVNSDLPLSEFILVCQQDVAVSNLPQLKSITASGKSLDAVLRGKPTTTPVRSSSDASLSGGVWKIAAPGYIPAGETIEIEFDKGVKPENISVFPLIGDVSFSTSGLTASGNPLRRVSPNVLSICKDENKAVVRVSLSDASHDLIPETLLRKTTVEIKSNSKSYPARFHDGSFEAEIELPEDETHYYAEIDCPGYFKRVTDIETIQKVACEEAQPVVKRNQLKDLGSWSFDKLKNEPIRLTIQDTETLEILDPAKFDISADIKNDFLFEDVNVRVEGEEVVIDAHPRGDWCECLFPLEVNMVVRSQQKDGAFADVGKTYSILEQPLHFTVEKSRGWFPRCKWVIFTLALLLLLMIYIRLLLKKHRFKKNARITSVYYDYYGSPKKGTGGRYLRREGFAAWLSRWFSPRDERVTLRWSQPAVSAFSLVASDSKEIVSIPKKSFPKTMHLASYDPEVEDEKEKFISWADGETINISKREGGKDGALTFVSGEEDDGTAFRLFLGILFVLCIVAFAIISWLMIKSFF